MPQHSTPARRAMTGNLNASPVPDGRCPPIPLTPPSRRPAPPLLPSCFLSLVLRKRSKRRVCMVVREVRDGQGGESMQPSPHLYRAAPEGATASARKLLG